MNRQTSVMECEKVPQNFVQEICGPVNALKGAVFCLSTYDVTDQFVHEIIEIMEDEILHLEEFISSTRHDSSM